MLSLPRRSMLAVGLMLIALFAAPPRSAAQSSAPVLEVDGLGKGSAPLEGPWQFHLGDNPAWALPQAGDDQNSVGWEQISPDKTWGAQGHPAYTGFAWYRKHIRLSPAPGASPDVALLIRHIDDAYEIYWNGQLIGRHGTMPPNPSWPYSPPAQTFGMGPAREGVLALRVWKGPLTSFDSEKLGGLYAAPIVGSPAAIAGLKAELDYTWLRSRQYDFGLNSLYFLVMVLSLLAWMRNRSQRVVLWMAVFSGAPVLITLLVGLRIPFSFNFALGWLQPVLALADISLWFVLLYLLKLDESSTFAHLTRLLAISSICATSLDGLLTMLDWSNPLIAPWVQATDGVLTVVFTLAEAYPLVLVAAALRKRLDATRWMVAIAALLDGMISVVRIAVQQGSRYTHWTLGEKIGAPLFTLNGNTFTAKTIASTLLLLAIIYAVYRYLQDSSQRQSVLEQEFKSARELQQVLIPETIPAIPGFALSSAYRPAQEVGGDFFQIMPLEGDHAGSTLIILGDVSGKGLRAAMTVSLIVGAVRTLARFAPNPAEMLSELNRRLFGRLQGGFATCLVLRLDPGGHCVIASAGHPAPFLNKHELGLPGALPLGVVAAAHYEETSMRLHEGDHFACYTDGLLEARSASGEIFSFERLGALFSSRPDATKAMEAAVDFGQDDDITVLTFTRLGTGEQSTTTISVPKFAQA
ncbi:MAG: SpoIIE family protein phosphatase [Acidobacteriota bacterium]|nr:SpoIIE family protein phosphatase [Acidobacteriota bacterium]